MGVVAAGLILTPTSAPGKPVAKRPPPVGLGSASASGELPLVVYFSKALKRPKWLAITFTADPAAPLEATFSLYCYRRATSRIVDHPVTSAGTYTARPNVRKAQRCFLSAFSSYLDLDQAGGLEVSARGKRKPKRKNAPRP